MPPDSFRVILHLKLLSRVHTYDSYVLRNYSVQYSVEILDFLSSVAPLSVSVMDESARRWIRGALKKVL